MAPTLCSPYKTQRFVSLKHVKILIYLQVNAPQASLPMKLTRTKHFLDGLCQLLGHLSLPFFKSLVWMPPWYVPLTIHATALDIIGRIIAVKLLQNVFLPLFSLFYVCHNHPYAIKLEGLHFYF